MPRCLSFHASYQCRQSGVCCSAGWKIPFNAEELRVVRSLPIAHGAIEASAQTGLARQDSSGRCSFLDGRAGSWSCEIHDIGGHASLPLQCRMFPRQVLHDPRGTFISLSHFCPTAVGLLFDDTLPVSIVDAPAGLIGDGTLDGLDARETWAPLLRPGVLMDYESYGVWERLGVELLTRSGIAPRDALQSLSAATARLTEWSPDREMPLQHAVRDAFGMLPPPPTCTPEPYDSAVKRWLAARLFGTWLIYQSEALATIVRYLHACHDVFLVELARDRNPREAIRRSDRLIVHDASSQQMATLLA